MFIKFIRRSIKHMFDIFFLIKEYFIYRNAMKYFNIKNSYKIIFKFDDLINYSNKIKQIDKYIKKNNLKVCWGIIGNSLEKMDINYYNFIKNNNNRNYQFFNHGYYHLGDTEYEFFNKSIEEQSSFIKKTQNIVFDRTGIVIEIFGAPCNRIDKNTSKAIEKFREIKYWFYGNDDFNGINIPRVIDMEKCIGKPQFSFFFENLKKLEQNIKTLTIQAHPYMWNYEKFLNFKFVVKFLQKQNCEFIFPEVLKAEEIK